MSVMRRFGTHGAAYDGYQTEGFSLHPSRRGPQPSGRPVRLNHSSNGPPRPSYPPRNQHGPRPIRGPRPMQGPGPFFRPPPRGPRPIRGPPPRQYRPPPHQPTSYDYYEEGYNDDNEEQFEDPYNLSGDWEDYETTATNDLNLVTPKLYEEWKAASEPIVKNKELDTWVPASKTTRIEEEKNNVPGHEYELWRRSQGVGLKGGVGTKRKLNKVAGGYTAAGKHPIAALKEKCPTCLFKEEDRERNEELKYWKLTASVTFTGYKFLGYGVTMKIAKANAAIKALTFLDVDGLHQMQDHICSDVYEQKQRMLESVMEEEKEESNIEEPWYIKVDAEENTTPVFHPKEAPTPDNQPVMFLRQWFGPDVQVSFGVSNPGFRPEIFSCTITVQGMAFEGNGRNKKEAQKMTAALTLQKLEANPPPIDNRLTSRPKKKKSKNSKKPAVSSELQMPTVDKVPVTTAPASNLSTSFVPATSQPLVSAAKTKILTTTSTTTPAYSISSLAKTSSSLAKTSSSLAKTSSSFGKTSSSFGKTSSTKTSSTKHYAVSSLAKKSPASSTKQSSNSYYDSSQYYHNYWNNQVAQTPSQSPYNTNTGTYSAAYSTNTSTAYGTNTSTAYGTNTSTFSASYGTGYDYSSLYGTGYGSGWGTYQYPPVPSPSYSVPTPPPPPPR